MNITFYLKGLDCANCAAKIENSVKECDFAKKVTLNFVAQKLTITTDSDNTNKISDKVRSIVAHYEPDVIVELADKNGSNEQISFKPQIIRIIISAVLFVLGIVSDTMISEKTDILNISIYLIYGASYITVAIPVIKATVKALLNKNFFNENMLMLIASIGAILIGEMHEAIAVMLFYSVGELFQSIAVGKSRSSIKALIGTKPETADIFSEGKYVTVSPYDVPVGSVIRVKAGEKIPICSNKGALYISNNDVSKIMQECHDLFKPGRIAQIVVFIQCFD